MGRVAKLCAENLQPLHIPVPDFSVPVTILQLLQIFAQNFCKLWSTASQQTGSDFCANEVQQRAVLAAGGFSSGRF
jgi:hypothetical protein